MWLLFTLATTAFWSLAELFYKKGARPDEKYAHLKIAVCVGFVMGVHAIATLIFKPDLGYDPVNLIKYFPVSLCYILSMALSFFGMRFIEESISDPIENTSGAIAALLSVIFLGNAIAGPSVAGIIIILIGILGVGYLENTGETKRSKKLGKTMAIVAFAMPFCYAIIDAVGSFLDIFYLDEVEASPLVNITEETIEEVANVSYELTFFAVAIILLVFMLIKGVKFDLPKQRDKGIAALCETAGQFTYVFAMSGNGTIAAPIISSVCVFSVILSRIFLKEKLTKKQYFFIGLVLIGIIILGIVEGD
ncbi:MAG: DMT family transporter [Lachnospiraceae bacterium]|nr:DMT family transporter [Lachnospiraceae bacterium]